LPLHYILPSENVYLSCYVCIFFIHTNFHPVFFLMCSTLACIFSFYSKFHLLFSFISLSLI
jgi:hypothetical protein